MCIRDSIYTNESSCCCYPAYSRPEWSTAVVGLILLPLLDLVGLSLLKSSTTIDGRDAAPPAHSMLRRTGQDFMALVPTRALLGGRLNILYRVCTTDQDSTSVPYQVPQYEYKYKSVLPPSLRESCVFSLKTRGYGVGTGFVRSQRT